MREKVKVLIVPALAIATLLIFCLDLVTPLGVVDWALYPVPLLLTLWIPHRYATWVLAAIASALTVLGGLYSPSGVIWDPFAFFNRAMGIGFIWASALIIMHRKRAEEALRDSEAQFRAMLDNSPMPVFLKDTEGRYFHVNRRFEQTFHISNEAIAGKTDDQVFPPEQAAVFLVNDLKVFQAGVPLQFEEVVLHDDGPHTSLVSKFPLRHGDGQLYAIGGIAVDITDRKRTEEARARLAAIVESSEDAIISLSPDGSILSWNQGAETMFGYTAEEIIGKPAVALCPPDRLAEIPQLTERLRRENRLDCFETVRRRKDGREIHVSLRLSPIKDETGRITGISKIVRDITERKQSEELIQTRTCQQAAVAELGQRALASTDLSALVNDAGSLVARTLRVEFSKVLELLPDRARLLLRAGVGWREGLVGHAIVPAGRDSQAGYTLASDVPVLVDDLRTETRFTAPPLLLDHGIVSGVSVIIQGNRQPFGVLGVHTSRQRTFTHDDAIFLQNVANVLAHALQRNRAEEALRESVTRLRAILDSEPACVSTMAVNGVLLTMNRAGLAMIGAESEREVTGTRIFDLIHSDDRSAYRYFHDRVCQGRPDVLQFRIQGLRGGERWLETHAAPIPGASGMISEIVGVTHDITERQRAKEALAQALQDLHNIMETVPDVMYVLNRQGQLVKWNKKLERVTGWRADELYERSALEFFPDEDKPHIAEKIQEAFIHGYAEAEGGLLTRSGTAIPHYWTGAVMKNVQGDVIGLTGIGRDITERKRAEEALRNAHAELEKQVQERTSDLTRANARLQQEIAERRRAQEEIQKRTWLLEATNKELEAFSYSVSHDLRAPLRGINGFSTALLQDYRDALDEQGRDYLQRVCAATQRMEQLIDDLLDLSRVTRGPLSYEPVDLSAMAEAVMKDLRQRQPDRQVDVVVAPGLVANGDARLLRVALENLLGNAWKFTAKRARGRIEFGTWQNATQRAYVVRDNGAGFDMTYAGKLFGAFQRLHTLAEFPGTGIGLATVQRIVHRHGGCVWAEGTVDQGAAFYFTL